MDSKIKIINNIIRHHWHLESIHTFNPFRLQTIEAKLRKSRGKGCYVCTHSRVPYITPSLPFKMALSTPFAYLI